MNAAIIGSRGFCDYELMLKEVSENTPAPITKIISGGAKGADTLAVRLSEEFDIPLVEYIPEWDKYGRRAGYVRNKKIIEEADVVFAFWDGISPGTLHSITLAKRSNKLLHITIKC